VNRTAEHGAAPDASGCAAVAGELSDVRRHQLVMGGRARYIPAVAAILALFVGIAVGVGLFQVSNALSLRSIHSDTEESLGWTALAVGVALLGLPLLALRRAIPARSIAPWVIGVLLAICTASGCVISGRPAPEWLNQDIAGATLILAGSSVALTLSVAGALADAEVRRFRVGHRIAGLGALLLAIVTSGAIPSWE